MKKSNQYSAVPMAGRNKDEVIEFGSRIGMAKACAQSHADRNGVDVMVMKNKKQLAIISPSGKY